EKPSATVRKTTASRAMFGRSRRRGRRCTTPGHGATGMPPDLPGGGANSGGPSGALTAVGRRAQPFGLRIGGEEDAAAPDGVDDRLRHGDGDRRAAPAPADPAVALGVLPA